MPLIRPFPGLRPASGRAGEVAAPPYDVMSETEAREIAEGRPWSFVHISRPEVDFPPPIDPFAPQVYVKARHNLAAMRESGILQQDASDCFYVYRLSTDNHSQLGVMAVASVEAYARGRIKRHELTRPAKEQDRVRQIDALNAQTGPVFLVCPDQPRLDELLQGVAADAPDMDVQLAGGVRHQIWVVSDDNTVRTLTGLFDAMPALYVADGHHRSAAAARVAEMRGRENPHSTGDEAHNYFLCAVFPQSQTRILDYNRVVRDLGGLSSEQFLKRLAEQFEITPSNCPVKPERNGCFGMYLQGQWYQLELNNSLIPREDPVARLDVSLLAQALLTPLLGITDQRTDERIDFVGGVRGLAALEQRVDSGEWAVAFSLYPTSMADLMAVSDQGSIMPPKSTWFEPKLADGLLTHLI